MKIAKYKTLSHPDKEVLDAHVNEYINNGWQPWGNNVYADGLFVQAVVMPE